jgi:hypothetical protein
MSLEDILKGASIPAVAAGIGLASLMPLLLHGVGGESRPLAKALLHKYFDMVEKFKELGAEKQEEWRDLVAEVRAERELQQAEQVAAAADSARQA